MICSHARLPVGSPSELCSRALVYISKGLGGLMGVSCGRGGLTPAWGCGYRNAMMLVSALQLLPLSPYSSHFQEPGVRPIQGWVEKAWRAGYDPEGKEQLKGKLVGTSKWIGTTGETAVCCADPDLYAMFTSLGVPCTLCKGTIPHTHSRRLSETSSS